jgi:hypothetical protein
MRCARTAAVTTRGFIKMQGALPIIVDAANSRHFG